MPEFLSEPATLANLLIAGMSYASGLWLGWALWSKKKENEDG